MIDFKEIPDGDAWEAFCRDYLVALGLVVEIPPAKGPDGGLDLLVKEQLRGSLASRPFTWLVSCKHYATSGKSVGTADEINITDRLEQHGADGFIGFYSTMASAALVTRLKELRDQKKIESYEIYDGTRIENGFHDAGLSGVLLQHLPKSHTSLRPIHPLLGRYQSLPCDVCGKDLLKASVTKETLRNITFATRYGIGDEPIIESVHFVCKGECDQRMDHLIHNRGLTTAWDDISDYCNPLIFIRRITGYTNQMRTAPNSYAKAAHDRLINFYITLSQRTLRQTNGEDRKALIDAIELEGLGV
ncbi:MULTISPECIES: restriction endonuclease [Mesorhizobium]|uniref:restriction endonuclease n=1 Tax=Mesorhizobium TaxID=68287 RepID=UPI0007ECDEC5|nr:MULTISPECIES: restriction endonuclease [Mesorhizobium]PBB52310.1 restriction endonuclease [Mesorhizobium loti]QIA25378.1 restriction endonuclease [Mesorhizobium sp. AA22]